MSLVDEVATDSVTRGVLKDDSAFKSLRDVIKKCNKILEQMLVRRERKYTLFFRIVQPNDLKDLMKMKSWNVKVEAAVSGIGNESKPLSGSESDATSDSVSITSNFSSSSSNIFNRGRTSLPVAGRIRARRATPTPDLRHKNLVVSDPSKSSADDGFSTFTAPLSTFNLSKMQKSISDIDDSQISIPSKFIQIKPSKTSQSSTTSAALGITPRAELVDVIIGLRNEKLSHALDSSCGNQSENNMKGIWLPKADVPTSVPKLPVEYVHRHRLMKQVVNSLIGRSDSDNQKDGDDAILGFSKITCITSRHADKSGNGKTTLAVAAIQTVEVRERFPDGIIWIQLGRKVLYEKDIRRLYEELYDQLLSNDMTFSEEEGEQIFARQSKSKTQPIKLIMNSDKDHKIKEAFTTNKLKSTYPSSNRKRYLSGDLDEVREDFLHIISQRRVLICLDDVWRIEDLRWFVRDPSYRLHNEIDDSSFHEQETLQLHHYLITTRIAGLLEPSKAHEIFVRIFSEQEAVKLFLFSAGRRVPVGKNSTVFNQVRMIVKGCGNSPLTLRLAGAMLRVRDRNWTLTSPCYVSLVEQSKLCLEEASRIRSFINSLGRVIDLSFSMISDIDIRMAIRRCFVSFAMIFSECDWVLSGKGVPRDVIVQIFSVVLSSTCRESSISSEYVLDTLEHLNLLHRANHGVNMTGVYETQDYENEGYVKESKSLINGSLDGYVYNIVDTAKRDDCVTHLKNTAAHVSYMINGSVRLFYEKNVGLIHICNRCTFKISYIAELMATRKSYSFAPKPDEFTAFSAQLEAESRRMIKGGQSHWLGNASKYFFNGQTIENSTARAEQFHELLMSSLLGAGKPISPSHIINTLIECIQIMKTQRYDSSIEKYIVNFLPTHLFRARMLLNARAILINSDFISLRIRILGTVEATRRHMADINDIRQELQKSEDGAQGQTNLTEPSDIGVEHISETNDNAPCKGSATSDVKGTSNSSADVHTIYRESTKRILDEVYRVDDIESSSENSLNIAICLSIIGSGLMKARLWKDAMHRFEEAYAIFRGLFGVNHIDVARSVNAIGRTLFKLGENRAALIKFLEASKIFDACGLNQHYEALMNSQMIATLFVATKEIEKAEAKFSDIIATKKSLHGPLSLHLAKVLYDTGLAFSKHGYLEAALRHYESSSAVIDYRLKQGVQHCFDIEFFNASFDTSLVEMNIASIKSKKNDYSGAVASYEKAVNFIRDCLSNEKDSQKISNLMRHLVFAVGRVGSLKMKQRDNIGALQAYQALLKTVDSSSPESSLREKAKAYVKCATLYRQMGTKGDNATSIVHLKEALQMYTSLYGADHKDTVAIASSLQQWKVQDIANDK